VDFFCISRIINNFCRRFSCDCPVEFVLNRGEKILCDRRIFIIIRRKSVDICDLLVKPPLTCANFPDSLKEFLEIVFAENSISLFEPFIIQNKSFDDVFLQGSGSPDAELGGLVGVDAVAC